MRILQVRGSPTAICKTIPLTCFKANQSKIKNYFCLLGYAKTVVEMNKSEGRTERLILSLTQNFLSNKKTAIQQPFPPALKKRCFAQLAAVDLRGRAYSLSTLRGAIISLSEGYNLIFILGVCEFLFHEEGNLDHKLEMNKVYVLFT